jgi:hypothetical protein
MAPSESDPSPSQLERLTPLAVLAVVLGVYMAICMPMAQGEIYADQDTINVHFPRRVALAESLKRGQPGFWYPYLHRGHSALCHGEGGILHPLRRLQVRSFDPTDGFCMEVALLYPAAFFAMFLFLRWRRRSTFACLWGGGLFAFSSYFTAHLGHMNHAWILTHLPLAALCLEATLARSSALAPLGLGLVYASMLLLGHPQMVWLTSLALGALWLFRGIQERSQKTFWVASGVAVMALAGGIMIGVLQLLPTIHGLGQSDRGSLSPQERNNYSAHPVHLLANLSPRFTQSATVGDYFYFKTGRTFLNNPSEYSVYFGAGLLAFFGTCLVLFGGRIREHLGWGAIAAMATVALALLLLVLGRNGGLNDLLAHVPGVSQLRCPNRYKVVLGFLLTTAVAHCWDMLRSESPSCSSRRQWWAFALAIPFLGLFALSFAMDGLQHGNNYALAPVHLRAIGPVLALAVIALTLVSARRRSAAALAVLALLCLLDLGLYGVKLVSARPRHDLARLRTMALKIPSTGQQFRALAENHQPILDGGLQANGFSGMPPLEPLDFSRETHRRLASINRAYAFVKDDSGRSVQQEVALPNALPRFRLARQLVHADDPLASIDSVDLEDTVVTTSETTTALDGPPLSSEETLAIVADDADVQRLAVRIQHERILVVSDSWTPDWVVQVDGNARPCLPLFAGAVRGVRVKPGEEAVLFRYRPAFFVQAQRIACAGAALLLALTLLLWRRGHRTPAPPR